MLTVPTPALSGGLEPSEDRKAHLVGLGPDLQAVSI